MTPDEKTWIESWKSAAVELERIRNSELRQLDGDAGLVLFGVTAENPMQNGLVILQAYFQRFRLLELEAKLAALDK